VAYFAGKVQSPRLEFWALKIDLTAPGLRIVVGGGEAADSDSGPGADNRIGTVNSTWVSGFVRRNNLLAGINATPFDPSSGKEGEERTIVGIAIAEERLLSRPNSRFDALVFYTDGRAALLSQGEMGEMTDSAASAKTAAIQNAVGGLHIILRENTLTQRALTAQPRFPRSAAGLSADGKTLYLLVIDGRRPGSIGATEAETARLLKRLGAWDGLNFDGGGSTALALRCPDGKVRTVNTPIHGGIPGNERGVAICLGIALN
jgi:exopolysaccharide biosynthesis protein